VAGTPVVGEAPSPGVESTPPQVGHEIAAKTPNTQGGTARDACALPGTHPHTLGPSRALPSPQPRGAPTVTAATEGVKRDPAGVLRTLRNFRALGITGRGKLG
jgi:hypothetical protein